MHVRPFRPTPGNRRCSCLARLLPVSLEQRACRTHVTVDAKSTISLLRLPVLTFPCLSFLVHICLTMPPPPARFCGAKHGAGRLAILFINRKPLNFHCLCNS